MTALEFEARYLSLYQDLSRYQDDALVRADEVESILFDLFSDVDFFVADPELRGPRDLDEHQLLASARATLAGLQALASGQVGPAGA